MLGWGSGWTRMVTATNFIGALVLSHLQLASSARPSVLLFCFQLLLLLVLLCVLPSCLSPLFAYHLLLDVLSSLSSR
jgi:hypothetical protein